VFSTANLAGFVTSMAFMGMITFLPLYLQLGHGTQATVSGMTLTPLMIGLIISSMISGRLVSQTGKYKPLMLAGSAVIVLAALALVMAGPHAGPLDMTWRIFVLGLGLGPSQSLYNIAVQNALPQSEVGVATAATQFFRQIGSTIGVAVFGAVLTHSLAAEAAKLPHPPGVAVKALTLSDLERFAIAEQSKPKPPPPAPGKPAPPAPKPDPLMAMIIATVQGMVSRAIHSVMLAGLAVAVLAFFVVMTVPALPLQGAYAQMGRKPQDAPPAH
jgi:MFS family permease